MGAPPPTQARTFVNSVPPLRAWASMKARKNGVAEPSTVGPWAAMRSGLVGRVPGVEQHQLAPPPQARW